MQISICCHIPATPRRAELCLWTAGDQRTFSEQECTCTTLPIALSMTGIVVCAQSFLWHTNAHMCPHLHMHKQPHTASVSPLSWGLAQGAFGLNRNWDGGGCWRREFSVSFNYSLWLGIMGGRIVLLYFLFLIY